MQTLEETLASGGAAGHHVPELVLEFVEFKGLGDLLWVHGYKRVSRLETGEYYYHGLSFLLTVLDILLVGEDQ